MSSRRLKGAPGRNIILLTPFFVSPLFYVVCLLFCYYQYYFICQCYRATLRISTFCCVCVSCLCVCFVFLTPLMSLTIQFQICVRCCISGLIFVCLKCLHMLLLLFFLVYLRVFVCVFGCYVARSIVVFMFVFLLCPCCRSSLFVSFTVLCFCFLFFCIMFLFTLFSLFTFYLFFKMSHIFLFSF